MFKYREDSAMALKSAVLTPPLTPRLVSTGVPDKLKAFPYGLRVNLRKLVELHHKVSFIV